MNLKEEMNLENSDQENQKSQEEQSNSENVIKNNESSKSFEDKPESTIDNENEYKFGWSRYSEKTNGRFAMLGFLAIILIELLSKNTFLKWAGIL